MAHDLNDNVSRSILFLLLLAAIKILNDLLGEKPEFNQIKANDHRMKLATKTLTLIFLAVTVAVPAIRIVLERSNQSVAGNRHAFNNRTAPSSNSGDQSDLQQKSSLERR